MNVPICWQSVTTSTRLGSLDVIVGACSGIVEEDDLMFGERVREGGRYFNKILIKGLRRKPTLVA